MALSAEIENDGGSKCQNWDAALTPKLRCGSECRNRKTMTALSVETENDGGSEHRNQDATLNAKIVKWWRFWAPKLRMMVALNAEIEMRLWTPKPWNDDGSERWN